MRRVILCDIDHVLANAAWRDGLIGQEGGWDAYHTAASDDLPVQDVVDMINALSSSFAVALPELEHYQVICLTTRPEKWRDMTMKWLVRHGVMLDEMLMRPNDDYRPTQNVKVDLALQRFGGAEELRNHVALLLDDNDAVTAAFRGLGITVCQVFARRD